MQSLETYQYHNRYSLFSRTQGITYDKLIEKIYSKMQLP
jgi:hypothetical protein